MNYKQFKRNVLGKQCRKCINETHGLHLKQRDCRYWIYPSYCDCCNQPQNIVVDIELFSRWKIWMLKNKSTDEG